MSTLLEQYLNFQDTYTKGYYSDMFIVVMQVGQFYEIFSTGIRGHNTAVLSREMNLVEGFRLLPNNEFYHTIAFPVVCLDKYTEILIRNGFSVVIVNELTCPPYIKRGVVKIISPSTNIEIVMDNEDDSNDEIPEEFLYLKI